MDDVRHYRLQLWWIGIFPQKLLNFDSFRHLLTVSFMVPWLFGRVDNILHSRVSILLEIFNACIFFNLNCSFRIVSLITSVALMSGSCLWWRLGERQRPPTMAESPSGSKPPWGQLLMTPQPLFPPSLWTSRMLEWEIFTQEWTKVSFAKKMTWRVLLMTHQIIFLTCKLVVYGGFENVADLLFFKRETLSCLRLTSSIQFLPWEALLIMKCHHFGSVRLHGCKSMLPLSIVNMRIFYCSFLKMTKCQSFKEISELFFPKNK